jgi:hypothetical protein
LSGNQRAGLPRPASGGPSAEFILSKVEGLRTGVGAASAGVSRLTKPDVALEGGGRRGR